MWSYILIFIVITVMILFYIRSEKPVFSVVIGSGTGLIGMALIGFLTTGLLQFNVLTILMSLIAGVPGVITVILLGKFIV